MISNIINHILKKKKKLKTMTSFPQPHCMLPSTETKSIQSTVISSDSNNSIYDSPECLKKSTTLSPLENFISQILDEVMMFSNKIVLNIIEDYNKSSNQISDIDYFISRSNYILSAYVNNNPFYTNNIYEAYDYITLVNVVSFWIFYKFMVNDDSLDVHLLTYHLTKNNIPIYSDTILDIELDILKSIDYRILKYV